MGQGQPKVSEKCILPTADLVLKKFFADLTERKVGLFLAEIGEIRIVERVP